MTDTAKPPPRTRSPRSGASPNVLDEINRVLVRSGVSEEIGLIVPHHPGRADFGLVGPLEIWTDERSPTTDLLELQSIETVHRGRKGRMDLSFADNWVAAQGAALEAGSGRSMDTSDLAEGETFVIDFCDPNATKALHIGHLRNLAIGSAMTGLTRICGASVITQSQIGDMGRSMGEAMAGYTLFGEALGSEGGRKWDHIIGDCYSRYVAGAADGKPVASLASDPALSREDLESPDLATEMMDRWNRHDPETRDLWKRVRGWVLEGQAQTLDRLGIRFDQTLYESDFVADLEAIGDLLLSSGLVERASSGAMLYRTGDQSYPLLVLRRPDGHSTQHLRYIALWFATRELMRSATSLEIMGDEWIPHARYGEALMRLLDADLVHPTHCLLHGMVEDKGGLVKSSLGEPLLVDSLLDELASDPRIAERAINQAHADQLAAAASLGFFLPFTTEKRVKLEPSLLLEPRSNAGWVLARAALTAWDPIFDGPPDPAPDDRQYRFLVTQSQVHRQLVRRSLNSLDTTPLARFYLPLSHWFLRGDPAPRLARAMRTVLAVGLTSLGLPLPHPSARDWLEARTGFVAGSSP